jgi:hypothetical protein
MATKLEGQGHAVDHAAPTDDANRLPKFEGGGAWWHRAAEDQSSTNPVAVALEVPSADFAIDGVSVARKLV